MTAPLGEIIKKGRKIKREGGRDGGGEKAIACIYACRSLAYATWNYLKINK